MNKLQLIRYILDHNTDLLSWYCYNNGTKEQPGIKDGFAMPEPNDLTYADVSTYGDGYWGYVADLIIEDAIKDGTITEEMIEFFIENNVSICTSIDGNNELQNINRPYKNQYTRKSSTDFYILKKKKMVNKYHLFSATVYTVTT